MQIGTIALQQNFGQSNNVVVDVSAFFAGSSQFWQLHKFVTTVLSWLLVVGCLVFNQRSVTHQIGSVDVGVVGMVVDDGAYHIIVTR